jgi:hypothetical protein
LTSKHVLSGSALCGWSANGGRLLTSQNSHKLTYPQPVRD